MSDPVETSPSAILAQFIVGFIASFAYLISLFYSISDLNTILSSRYLLPLASIYEQATNSASGTIGLLILAFLPNVITCTVCYITASRVFWTLARDNAMPFAGTFAKVSPRYRNPFNAVLFCWDYCYASELHLSRLLYGFQRLGGLFRRPLESIIPSSYPTSPPTPQIRHRARLVLDAWPYGFYCRRCGVLAHHRLCGHILFPVLHACCCVFDELC
ncbi:hypothetical protein N7G274_003165 [Stereocaulon virgatum]|uniref:Uncharacterized protein n=1 Tax=Stereocaulon virgatum TaxID=373712 RepID=A0ABR4AH17_9LECA